MVAAEPKKPQLFEQRDGATAGGVQGASSCSNFQPSWAMAIESLWKEEKIRKGL